jgi:hypothetical protein
MRWSIERRTDTSRQRLAVATAVGLMAAALALLIHRLAPGKLPDIGILLEVSRGYLHGHNPYDVMGPGKAVEFPELMAYPFTEVLLLAPFAVLPNPVAETLVVALTCGLWSWALLGSRHYRVGLIGGLSLAALFVTGEGQWSPLLIAAALTPSLGWLLAIKPTIGLALFSAFPSWKTLVGGAAFVFVALVLYPLWPFEWYRTTRTVHHLVAIVTRPGGFLVLLALVRWKEPTARLLVALSCIPHTTLPYETLYLFLIPQTTGRAWVLCFLSYLAPILVGPVNSMTVEYVQRYADAILWTAYIPCAAMLLFPPKPAGTPPLTSPIELSNVLKINTLLRISRHQT